MQTEVSDGQWVDGAVGFRRQASGAIEKKRRLWVKGDGIRWSVGAKRV